MVNEWEFARATGQCAVTGRPFAEGESYYTVLFELPDGFERSDYSDEAWAGPPEGCFCFWRTRVPVREKKPSFITIDQETLIQLFLRLEDSESRMKQQFRFVLALLLMRKRLLKFEQTVRDENRECWQMRLVREQSVHQVVNPHLTDEEIQRLSEQLSAILSGNVESLRSMEEPSSEEPAAGESEPRTPATMSPASCDNGGEPTPVPNQEDDSSC